MNKALRESKPNRIRLREVRKHMEEQEQLVYAAMRTCAITRNFCPSNKTIAMSTRLSENTVVKAIARLRRAKRLDVEVVQGRRVVTFSDGIKTKLPLITGHEPKRTTGKIKIPCLCCDKPFWSVDRRVNRMCASCK